MTTPDDAGEEIRMAHRRQKPPRLADLARWEKEQVCRGPDPTAYSNRP